MKLSVPKFIITVHKNTSKLQYVTRDCEKNHYSLRSGSIREDC